MHKNERNRIMNQLCDTQNGIVSADTTILFEETALSLIDDTESKYLSFRTYFEEHLKKKILENINRAQQHLDNKSVWININAESINNIIKVQTN